MATNEKTIQDGLIELLTDNEADLRLADGRTVAIGYEWEGARSQRSMPLVIVNRPTLEDGPQNYSAGFDRHVYVLEVWCMDGAKGQPTQRRESLERIEQLRANVLAVFRAAPHLNLAALRVFESHARYQQLEREDVLGGQFHKAAFEMTIPTITAR